MWNDCKLPCGHIYHAECISFWLNKDHSKTCPICRKTSDMDELPDINNAIDNVLHKIMYLGYGIPVNHDEIVELIMTKFFGIYTHQ
jgi:hypothetical protein